MNQTISIIVPVYNTEDYLPKCIDSILGQTYKDIELILVNDASIERSGLICDKYAKTDKRIKVIHQNHQGVSEARNTGLSNSQGDFISFVDSDDYIHPDMLDKLYYHLKTNKADIAICNYMAFFENEEALDEKAYYSLKNDQEEVYILNKLEVLERLVDGVKPYYVYIWNKLYKKEMFKNIKFPNVQIHEDSFTTYKILFNSERIVYTTEKLYYYLQRKNSLSKMSFSKINLYNLDALKEITDFFFENKLFNLHSKAAFKYISSIIKYYYYYKRSQSGDKTTLRLLINRYRKELFRYSIIRSISFKKRFRLLCFYIHPQIHSAVVGFFTYYNGLIK